MNLFINGSNRKKNCYRILNDIKEKEDKLISLSDKKINFCKGCCSCIKELDTYCIMQDNMQEIYKGIIDSDKIIIASPIYMNHITGILKNVIDRLNPFSNHGNLKGKKIYLILIGQMSEEDNKEIADSVNQFFESISEFMEFEYHFIKCLSSGDIQEIDDITATYKDYETLIREIKEEISN